MALCKTHRLGTGGGCDALGDLRKLVVKDENEEPDDLTNAQLVDLE